MLELKGILVKCNGCGNPHHMITNTNRNKWKTFFQALLKEQYDYQYTKDQKIILDFTKEDDKR